MNRYENITIIDADAGEDEKKALLERIESQISKRNGTLLKFDEWGMQKLAYEIRKKKQGQYVRTDFCGNGEIVDGIERLLRHDQRVLRFMTVGLEENIDPEALKAQYTEKQQAGQGAEEKTGAEPEEQAAGAENESFEPETEEAIQADESTPASEQKEQ